MLKLFLRVHHATFFLQCDASTLRGGVEYQKKALSFLYRSASTSMVDSCSIAFSVGDTVGDDTFHQTSPVKVGLLRLENTVCPSPIIHHSIPFKSSRRGNSQA